VSLEYALITDSSLPTAVKESEYYVSVDKKQWLDLIDYSENIVDKDDSQKILFLIVAKGTEEQEEADEQKRLEEKQEKNRLAQERKELEDNLSEKEIAEQKRLNDESARLKEKENLREKSKSIFNALYNR
jgi:hypothetical protein